VVVGILVLTASCSGKPNDLRHYATQDPVATTTTTSADVAGALMTDATVLEIGFHPNIPQKSTVLAALPVQFPVHPVPPALPLIAPLVRSLKSATRIVAWAPPAENKSTKPAHTQIAHFLIADPPLLVCIIYYYSTILCYESRFQQNYAIRYTLAQMTPLALAYAWLRVTVT